MMRPKTTLAVILLAVAGTACERADDQRTDSIRDQDVMAARAELDPAVRDALDAGNAAYRERDYDTALEHFHTVVEMRPELAAGWFGIYMAQLALGNADAAEAAMAQARTHAPGASLIHPDPDLPVPADHPSVETPQQ